MVSHATISVMSEPRPLIEQLDIRVGKILTVERLSNAKNLYAEKVDFGDQIRTVVSGLVKYFSASELEGLHCIFVTNLKPRMIMGLCSEAMILIASNEDQKKLLCPPSDAVPGDKVVAFDDDTIEHISEVDFETFLSVQKHLGVRNRKVMFLDMYELRVPGKGTITTDIVDGSIS